MFFVYLRFYPLTKNTIVAKRPNAAIGTDFNCMAECARPWIHVTDISKSRVSQASCCWFSSNKKLREEGQYYSLYGGRKRVLLFFNGFLLFYWSMCVCDFVFIQLRLNCACVTSRSTIKIQTRQSQINPPRVLFVCIFTHLTSIERTP